ncbi:MAG: hypothetical protein LBF41_06135 [Deltaproteobacteria bacterium]|nr:hypothetical protein [Deltaproteobacteria bacterium]
MKIGKSRLPVIIAVILCFGIILAVSLSNVDGDKPKSVESSAGFDTGSYSSSALGSLLFYESLRETREFVGRVVSGTPFPVDRTDVGIILAAPNYSLRSSFEGTREMREALGDVFLVLPKWRGGQDYFNSDWIKDAELNSPLTAARAFCSMADCSEGEPEILDVPRANVPDPTRNELGVAPRFARDTARLVNFPGMRQVVAYPGGTLLGELKTRKGGRLFVLSDPDPVSNHGILEGKNLEFALAAVERWTDGKPDMTIFFDERHVALKAPANPLDLSSFERFLTYPSNLILILTLLASVLFVLFGLKRYWPEVEEPETVVFGKEKLIANAARLLERGDMRREVFLRYLRMTIQHMGRSLRAPPDAMGSEEELLAFLDARLPRGERAKSLTAFYREAAAEARGDASPARLVRYARLFHEWKEETEIGPGTG